MIMKTNYIFRMVAALAAVCAFMISCQPENVGDNGDGSLFPEYKEYTVTPGEIVTISFDVDKAWEIAVPDNTMQWFWIQDGDFQLYRLFGKAGSHSVTICVSDKEELDSDRTCKVTMTIGGKSQEIASLTRPAKEKTIKVYAAKVIDNEVQFADDGGYLYMEEQQTSMELVWGESGSDFRLPVKVEANFNWTYQGPEWLKIDVPANGVGTNEVLLCGVPSKYPLSDDSGTLKFFYGDLVVAEYEVRISGCESRFSCRMNMNLSEIYFDFTGKKIRTSSGNVDGPASGTVSGTSGVRIEVLTKTEEGYTDVEPSWLDVEIAGYDDTEGAPVLQDREFTVSAEVNEGDDRTAVILLMSPVLAQVEALQLLQDPALQEEYQQHFVMIPVTQLTSDQQFVSMAASPADVAAAGITFIQTEDGTYELTYNSRYSSDSAGKMMFASAVTSYKVESETGFLSFSLDDDKLGGTVKMDADEPSVGLLTLYGASGDNVLAEVKCILDPEQEVEEVEDVCFVGKSVTTAEKYGASLEKITEGPLYDKYRGEGAPIWSLTYTQENQPMLISLPSSAKSYCPNPFLSMDYVNINGVHFYDSLPTGSFKRKEESGVEIHMNMPEGETYMRVAMYFYSVANGGQGSNDTLVLILVCTMDLSGTAE